MKYTLLKFLAVAMCVLCVSSAKGAVLATWNFTTADSSSPFNGTAGTPSYITGTPTISTSGGQVTPTVTGGVLNYSWSGNGAASKLNGAQLAITLTINSSSTVSGLSIAGSAVVSGKLKSTTGTWEYQINNGTTQSFGTTATINSTSTSIAGANSGINLNSGDKLTLYFTLGSSTAYNGTGSYGLAFDNITISGVNVVPEPTHYALAVFGFIFIGGTASRHFLLRRRNS